MSRRRRLRHAYVMVSVAIVRRRSYAHGYQQALRCLLRHTRRAARCATASFVLSYAVALRHTLPDNVDEITIRKARPRCRMLEAPAPAGARGLCLRCRLMFIDARSYGAYAPIFSHVYAYGGRYACRLPA